MIGSPLTSAHTLREGLPNVMWKELKRTLSRQYSSIPFNSHTSQAFAYLQQGPDELLEMYLHHECELLLKIHHTSDMSHISAASLNHYTVGYGLKFQQVECCGIVEYAMEVNGRLLQSYPYI